MLECCNLNHNNSLFGGFSAGLRHGKSHYINKTLYINVGLIQIMRLSENKNLGSKNVFSINCY